MEDPSKPLIETLRGSIQMVVRATGSSGESLDGVLSQQELKRCCELLGQALGPPIKDFGKTVAFEPTIRKFVEQLGGLRANQCLYLRQDKNQRVVYAALWPWASDPNRVTLKVGSGTLSSAAG